MPTTSVAGSITITNLGPLTTTFTAPSSCSTELPVSGIDLQYNAAHVMLAYPVGTCGNETWEEGAAACLPHGAKLGEIEHTAVNERTVGYYSPGLHCPENYQTVGVAVNNGSSYGEVSGLFAPPFTVVTYDYYATTDGYTTYTTDFPDMNFEGNQLTSALGPGETLVACCPSGYTADIYAGCYSSFDATELASSSGCYNLYTGSDYPEDSFSTVETVTWEYQGTETTETTNPYPFPTDFFDAVTQVTYTYDESGRPTHDEVEWPEDNWPSYSISWQSYSASWHSGYLPSLSSALASAYPDATSAPGDVEELSSAIADATLASDDWPEETSWFEEPEPQGVAGVGIIWLVHNASDLEAASTSEEGGAEETGGDDEGAAASVPANMWTLAGAMAAVWGIGAVAGAGLLV